MIFLHADYLKDSDSIIIQNSYFHTFFKYQITLILNVTILVQKMKMEIYPLLLFRENLT